MIFAYLDGKKVKASRNQKGICPHCGKDVVSKCGSINIWHWAHIKNESCDSWYEPETKWHSDWKMEFGEECSEVKISKENRYHIADIFSNDVVIELQNSPIQKEVISKREEFYGEKMIWIINGEKFKNNFIITELIDVDNCLNVKYDPIYQKYKEDNKKPPKYKFVWNHCRKCWNDHKRNIFIDFGEDELFWVKDGMGTKNGYGNIVKKEKFISKYRSKLTEKEE